MVRVRAAACLFVVTSLWGIGPAAADDLLRVAGYVVKWPLSASGGATVISYAILTDPYVLPSDRATLSPDNCGAMSAFGDVIAGSSGLSLERARRELRAAFTSWERVANIKFVDVGDSSRANIVIGASVSPQGRAFANLSYRGKQGANSDTMSCRLA